MVVLISLGPIANYYPVVCIEAVSNKCSRGLLGKSFRLQRKTNVSFFVRNFFDAFSGMSFSYMMDGSYIFELATA